MRATLVVLTTSTAFLLACGGLLFQDTWSWDTGPSPLLEKLDDWDPATLRAKVSAAGWRIDHCDRYGSGMYYAETYCYAYKDGGSARFTVTAYGWDDWVANRTARITPAIRRIWLRYRADIGTGCGQ